jgi:cytoskeletal protein RodZ
MAVNESEEQALERLLQRSSPLSRAYQQLKDESPAPALDRAVIAAARDAVGARAQRRRKHWHWPTLALAATVLLSFGIVMRMSLQPVPQSTAPAAPPPAPPQLEKAPAAPQARDLDSAASAATSANAVSAPAAAAPQGGARFDALAARERTRSEPSALEEDRLEAQASAPDASPTADQPALPAQERAAGRLASPPTANRSVTAGVPSASGVAALAAPKDARQKAALKKAGVKPAKEWLEEISRLRASGEVDAADREYANFLRAYPNYVQQDVTAPTK